MPSELYHPGGMRIGACITRIIPYRRPPLNPLKPKILVMLDSL